MLGATDMRVGTRDYFAFHARRYLREALIAYHAACATPDSEENKIEYAMLRQIARDLIARGQRISK